MRKRRNTRRGPGLKQSVPLVVCNSKTREETDVDEKGGLAIDVTKNLGCLI